MLAVLAETGWEEGSGEGTPVGKGTGDPFTSISSFQMLPRAGRSQGCPFS